MKERPQGPVVRPAGAADVPAVFQVVASAFRLEEGTEKWAHARQSAGDWGSFLVLEVAGEILGAARIGRDRLRLGRDAALLKGDVGHVSIARQVQGAGLGTLLMQGVVRHMDTQGFHLSRLGGYNVFYERFGYVPFPRRFFEFPLEPVGAGAATLHPEEFLATTPEDEDRLRAYAPDGDWSERCRLYDCFHEAHTAAWIEGRGGPAPSGGPDTTGLRWVYEEDGSHRAYALATTSGAMVEIHDAAFEPGFPRAFAAVVRRVLWDAVRQGARQGLGRLPHDARVEAALVDGRVPYILREVQTAPASNMLRLIRLDRFLDAAVPEWTRRLRDAGPAPWSGVLALQVGGETAALTIGADGVARVPKGREDARIGLSPRDFLLVALGHRGWHETAPLAQGEASPALASTLGTFLRRDTVASGPLG